MFIKPTVAGRKLIGDVVEIPHYKGAKPYYFISGEFWDDSDWLTDLVRMSVEELPAPKTKPLNTIPNT